MCVCVCVFSSVIRVLRKPTEARRQQLRSDHEAAAALCLKLGVQSCKELRETRVVCFERLICWQAKASSWDLALLGTLGSVLPALEVLRLIERPGASGLDGVQPLAVGLGADALPASSSSQTRLTRGCPPLARLVLTI